MTNPQHENKIERQKEIAKLTNNLESINYVLNLEDEESKKRFLIAIGLFPGFVGLSVLGIALSTIFLIKNILETVHLRIDPFNYTELLYTYQGGQVEYGYLSDYQIDLNFQERTRIRDVKILKCVLISLLIASMLIVLSTFLYMNRDIKKIAAYHKAKGIDDKSLPNSKDSIITRLGEIAPDEVNKTPKMRAEDQKAPKVLAKITKLEKLREISYERRRKEALKEDLKFLIAPFTLLAGITVAASFLSKCIASAISLRMKDSDYFGSIFGYFNDYTMYLSHNFQDISMERDTQIMKAVLLSALLIVLLIGLACYLYKNEEHFEYRKVYRMTDKELDKKIEDLKSSIRSKRENTTRSAQAYLLDDNDPLSDLTSYSRITEEEIIPFKGAVVFTIASMISTAFTINR